MRETNEQAGAVMKDARQPDGLAKPEQSELFDRLRSGDDPVHEDAAQASFKESCGCEAPAGATYAEALAALGLREISTTAHNARTFDNNTMAAKEAATNGAFSRQENHRG